MREKHVSLLIKLPGMIYKINFALFCSSFNFSNQLLNLLLYACGNVDDSQSCRLNFREAVRANNNQPSLNLLSSYSSQYFAETEYNQCIDIIDVSFFGKYPQTFFFIYYLILFRPQQYFKMHFASQDIAVLFDVCEESTRKDWLVPYIYFFNIKSVLSTQLCNRNSWRKNRTLVAKFTENKNIMSDQTTIA